MKIIETGDGYGIELQEYKGKYSLISCREANGTMYQQWARYRVGKDKLADKEWPVKVVLGNIKQARQALSQLLDQLCDDKEDEDFPF